MNAIEIVSASAGSGKTYKLVSVLEAALVDPNHPVRPEAIIATTFTVKAAAELRERVRLRLLANGHVSAAQRMSAARIGTVNSVCGTLVSEYAFELGLSPELRGLDESAADEAFEKALAARVSLEPDADGVMSTDNASALALQDLAERMPGLEWLERVRELATYARTNRIEPEALRACADRSIESLFRQLSPASDDGQALEDRIVDTVRAFVASPALDATKTTKEVVDNATRFLREIDDGRLPTWPDWARLVRMADKVAVKSRALYAPVVSAARTIEQHPRLHEDLRSAIRHVHDLAAQALVDYQAYKRQWGLLDFVDQERHALTLLELPHVQEQLRGSLDLVLVDEFQDTSPLQLEVFLALARIAPRSVWVGDQKQAIYGFRGTDPALMDTVVQAIEERSQKAVETLTESWRSRAGLVRLTSEVFAAAFATQGIPAERVKLSPSPRTPDPDDLGPVVELWRYRVGSQRKSEAAAAVVTGVADLLQDEDTRVRDRVTGESRRARAGDLAVLCRRHADALRLADALEEAGFRAIIGRPGLLETLEVRVVIAALRLWVDAHDAFAAAELGRLLAMPDDPAGWLERLLATPKQAFFDLPEVVRIVERKAASPATGVLAVFDAAMEAVGVRELCLRWGRSAQRHANLDRLRAHALDYLARCGDDQRTPTLPGLVVALLHLADKHDDEQATPAEEDAVTLMTLHGAKGLEWPIVLMHGLDRNMDPDVFGVHVMTDGDGFRFESPLAGRWLRFWPDPFVTPASRYASRPSHKGMELHDRTLDCAERREVASREERELLRLLYVGWTRARDRLVLTTKAEKLLEHDWGRFRDASGQPILTEPEHGGPVTWAGHAFDLRVREMTMTRIPAEPTTSDSGYPIATPRAYPLARVQPSGLERTCELGALERLTPAMTPQRTEDYLELGDAIHAFFAGDQPSDTKDARAVMAEAQLQAFGVAECVPPADLARSAEALRAWIGQRWPEAVWRREWPLQWRMPDGSEVRGYADLVLETRGGLVVLDHKCLNCGYDEALAAAAGYHGQLSAYAEMLTRALGRPVIGRWIHLVFQGVCVELQSSS